MLDNQGLKCFSLIMCLTVSYSLPFSYIFDIPTIICKNRATQRKYTTYKNSAINILKKLTLTYCKEICCTLSFIDETRQI
ncbi:hypothetical protein N9I19_24975, partial [Peribacillus sp. CSMR9]|nr:hypothetical protein [Peribacillus sp. CSMR9]